jgi:hypothetical protein
MWERSRLHEFWLILVGSARFSLIYSWVVRPAQDW